MSERVALMKLALGYKVATDIIEADDAIAPTERAFVLTRFPFAELQDAGFVSPSGEPTPRMGALLDEALIQVPTAVPLPERLEMFDNFIDAVAADGELSPGEAEVLRGGAAMLGLDDKQIDDRLEAHPAVGTVELGLPEE